MRQVITRTVCHQLGGGFIVALIGVDGVEREERLIISADIVGRQLEGAQGFGDGVPDGAFRTVLWGGSAQRDGNAEFLILERFAFRAVGPPVCQHLVAPLFQKRRAIKPVHRELKHNVLMLFHKSLLALYINHTVRVLAVQLMHGKPIRMLAQHVNPGFADRRIMDIRMRDNHKGFHGISFRST